jgi:hypothetical protein
MSMPARISLPREIIGILIKTLQCKQEQDILLYSQMIAVNQHMEQGGRDV